LTDNLPKTRSGKIMRRLLRAVARGEEITQDMSTLENPAILEQLRGSATTTASAVEVPSPTKVLKKAVKKATRKVAKKAAKPSAAKSAKKPAKKTAKKTPKRAAKKTAKKTAKAVKKPAKRAKGKTPRPRPARRTR
jgi:vesicle coat complex subunit